MHDEPTIRPADPGDGAAVAALAHELGYELDDAEATCRIAALGPDAAAFVAVAAGEPVGWIHVYRSHLLQEAPFAEIGGLVVTATVRGAGVGQALMAAAETWAAEHGLPNLRLRSRVAREGAHRFYERLGYVVEKTSFTFRKEIPIPPPLGESEE